MLVVASQSFQFVFLYLLIVSKEVELHFGRFALMLMQFVEIVDDGLRTNVLMLVQTADVCSQLGHVVRIVLVVILILVQPIEFRIASTLELVAEYVVFTLFRHSANGHLFFTLVFTIGDSSPLVVVLKTANGTIFIVFHGFSIFRLIVFQIVQYL